MFVSTTNCGPSDDFYVPTDPNEPLIITVDQFIRNYKKLDDQKVVLVGYLVNKDNILRVISNKQDDLYLQSEESYANSIFIRINSPFDPSDANNNPYNCVNKSVSIHGRAGFLQEYPSFGIYQTTKITDIYKNNTSDDKPCYVAPSYSASILEVKIAQTLLSSLGYKAGVTNGYIQEETREAVKAFQLDQGEPQTGRIDDLLLLELSQAVAEH